MTSLIPLIDLVIRGAIYLIMGAIILSMVGQALRARWLYHPVVRGIIVLGLGLCAPFRRLMERFGIPTRPLDFSPMLAVLALQVLESLLIRLVISL